MDYWKEYIVLIIIAIIISIFVGMYIMTDPYTKGQIEQDDTVENSIEKSRFLLTKDIQFVRFAHAFIAALIGTTLIVLLVLKKIPPISTTIIIFFIAFISIVAIGEFYALHTEEERKDYKLLQHIENIENNL